MAKKKARKKSEKSTWIYIAAVVVLSVLGIYAFTVYQRLFKPNVKLEGNTDAFVYIRSSDTYENFLESLEKSGFIVDVELFDKAARQKDLPKALRPGKYALEEGMTNNALINKIKAGNQTAVKVRLNAERNLAEIAGTLSKLTEADSLELIDRLTDEDTAKYYGFTRSTFIAMFIPNTYEFYWASNASAVLKRFANEYKKVWNESRRQRAVDMGLNPDEVTTLASIVAQETAIRSEAPRIAGVYLNRLRKDMPLQADPTLRFAANDPTIRRLLNSDKNIDSPYNTYVNKGLPPGPIGLADVRFIDAVLQAESHEYLYFCAKDDFSGYSLFTSNYAEHQNNARRYQRALSKRGIYR